MRIDKWLWAARFFKTRTIAQEEVGLGRVHIDGQRMKASRDVRVGTASRSAAARRPSMSLSKDSPILAGLPQRLRSSIVKPRRAR